ncbi:hypothetical protein CHUAL_005511 [Chamberlinius hualienensis]
MVEMTISKFLVVSLGLIFAVGLQVHVIGARPAPDQVAAMAEALKVLQQLDRHYAQIAKPRIRRFGSSVISAAMTPTNNGGIRSSSGDHQEQARLLHLLYLDRHYAQRTKPRFGRSLNPHPFHDSTENEVNVYGDTAEEYKR